MSVIKRIRSDLHTMNPIYPLCGGIGMAILSVVTLMSSNCHPIYHWMLLPRGALPYFLFAALGILLMFLLGAALGILFSASCCRQKIGVSLASLICDTIATMVWYHVLFRSFHSLIAVVLLFLCITLELLLIRENLFENSLIMLVCLPVLVIRLHFIWLNIGICFLN